MEIPKVLAISPKTWRDSREYMANESASSLRICCIVSPSSWATCISVVEILEDPRTIGWLNFFPDGVELGAADIIKKLQ